MKNVLVHISGSPFVSLHLLESLCESEEVKRIFLLASGSGDVEPLVARLPHAVDADGAAAGAKLRVLKDGLRPYQSGAPDALWGELAGSVDTVLYCVERQYPEAGLDAARALYVEPMKNWIAFLEDNEQVRLGFLSTAFVAGRRRGLFTEFDLDCGQGFRDPWEQSMFEAEGLLRGSAVSERVTVFRPSHVVGDSRCGNAYAFKGIYSFLRSLCQDGLKFVAGDPSTRLDVVPVDYVADAVIALSGLADSAGKNFHLVAGWRSSMTLKDFVGEVTSHGRGGSRKVLIAPPILAGMLRGLDALKPGRVAAHSNGSSAWRYDLTQTAVFDDYRARAALESKEILCAPLDSYLGKIIQFAEERGWQPAAGKEGSGIHLRALALKRPST